MLSTGPLGVAVAFALSSAVVLAAPAPSPAPSVGGTAAETTGASAGGKAESANPNAPASFEAALREAVPMEDLGTLLSALTGKCSGEKRELDRVRCAGTRSYLRRVIPQRLFWGFADDRMALMVSEYDASIKGYHLSIAGCLACSQPVTVGSTKDKRVVTLKVPDKEAQSLRSSVELGRTAISFESVTQAKAWLAKSRAALRLQVIFRPSDTEWSYGGERGIALALIGMRLYDRCTGQVLTSRPPSVEKIDDAGSSDGCSGDSGTATAAETEDGRGDATELTELSKTDINRVMSVIRPQIFACFEKFNVPGMAQLEYDVAGNGAVTHVRVSGPFQGTPTGACLLEAAHSARFPRFSRERQQFSYPFFLRR